MKFPILHLAMAAALACQTSLTVAREWVDNTGQFRIEAELVSVQDGVVTLKKPDGEIITVPRERLSPADRDYIDNLNRAAPPAPQVVVVAADSAVGRPTAFQFDNLPLAVAVEELTLKTHTNIVINSQALFDLRITDSIPVTHKSAGGILGDELTAMLAPLQLEWHVYCDVILITGPKTWTPSEARVYRLTRPGDPRALAADIRQRVAPRSWIGAGGPGNIAVFGSVLVIDQRDRQHREVEKAYAGQLQRVSLPPARRAGLEQLVDCDFQGTPLLDVLAMLSGKTKVGLKLNKPDLEAVGVDGNSPVTLQLRAVRLGSVLRLLGVGLGHESLGLDFVPDRNGFLITIAEDSMMRLTSRQYDVRDLARGNPQPVARLIQDVIDPVSWSDSGGAGSIRVAGPQTLAVSQTHHNHAAIARLLAEIRLAAR